MYLVSIYFDEKTDERIRKYINQAAKRNGNTYMIDGKVPPHITISAFETRQEDAAVRMLARAADGIKSGAISWASVGAFFPGVIYLSPVLNEYLYELSLKVYAAVSEIQDVRISKMYRPLQWMPHTTIAKKLEREEMLKAFQVMQEQFGMFTGQAVSIGLARTNPYEDLVRIELRKE